MWAITDFTEENGATRIIPGSHLRDEPPNPLEHYDTIPAEMPKGSVLVWVGSLWHGGGANRTDTRRVGIAMNYCAGYIRQQENQQLGHPAAAGQDLPPAPAGADRLLRLQRSRRPHRQATPGQGRPRRGRGRRHGLGPAQDLTDRLTPPAAPPEPPATRSRGGRSGIFPSASRHESQLAVHFRCQSICSWCSRVRSHSHRSVVAHGECEQHLDRGRGVRHGIVGLTDLDPVVAAQVAQRPPPLRSGSKWRSITPASSTGPHHPARPGPHRRVSGLRLEDRQVVVELHAGQRNARRRQRARRPRRGRSPRTTACPPRGPAPSRCHGPPPPRPECHVPDRSGRTSS